MYFNICRQARIWRQSEAVASAKVGFSIFWGTNNLPHDLNNWQMSIYIYSTNYVFKKGYFHVINVHK